MIGTVSLKATWNTGGGGGGSGGGPLSNGVSVNLPAVSSGNFGGLDLEALAEAFIA